MASSMSRLQLAHRIHQLLLREIDHAIEVERLLADPLYARDVLLVCDAVPGGELAPLAALFRDVSWPTPRLPQGPGHAPQDTEWGLDTSGFGVSRPATLTNAPSPTTEPAAERRRGWLPRWRDNT